MDAYLDGLASLVALCRAAPFNPGDMLAGYESAIYAACDAGCITHMEKYELFDILDDMRDLAHIANIRNTSAEAA